MSKHTSFKVGGPARYFIKVNNPDSLPCALEFPQERNIPFFILGNGTNLLVSDNGFPGVIIALGNRYNEIQDLGNGILKVGSAASLAGFARKTIKKGLSGIHKLAGVPGSIGGAIFMNAGAYGQEISQTCIEVETMDRAGILHRRAAHLCGFSYRHSLFQELNADPDTAEIILSATFQLEENSGKDAYTLETEMQECMAKRKASQPLNMPNAGSTFKRLTTGSATMPQQVAPGYYIEQAGLKGYRIGGAEVSQVHANFIVNAGGASAKDILQLSEFVQKTVAEKFNIQLQREIVLLGEF